MKLNYNLIDLVFRLITCECSQVFTGEYDNYNIPIGAGINFYGEINSELYDLVYDGI